MSHIVDHKLASSSNALLSDFFLTQSKEINSDSPAYLGLTVVGPALLAFFDWINDSVESNKINHLLFENKGMMGIYNFYLTHKVNSSSTSSNVSVKSLKQTGDKIFLAGITEGNFDKNFLSKFYQADKFSLSVSLETFGIATPTPYVLSESGAVESDYICTHNPHGTELFLQAWRSQIVKAARNERRNLLQNLLSSGIEEGQRLAIVDLGFDGFLQENFETAIDQTIGLDVFGLNFALNDSVESKRRTKRFRMSGLLDSRNTSRDALRSLEKGVAEFEAFWGPSKSENLETSDLSIPGVQISKDIEKGVEHFLKVFLKQHQGRSPRRMVPEFIRPLINRIAG